MNVLKYRVSLDMFDTHSQTTIKAKKSDSACQIHITLSEKGKIYNIGEGCSATFNARKSDGNFIYDNCTIENNTIVYDFTSSVDENGVCQVSACEGIVECEVTLYNADGKQLTSPRFTLFVDGTVYNGEEIASTPQSDFFKEIVDEAVRTKQDFFALVSGENNDKILTFMGGATIGTSGDISINSGGRTYIGAQTGEVLTLYGDRIEIHGEIQAFRDIDFPYGNGKITNLVTPDGTDPTQAANVEFVANSRKMRLIVDVTITDESTTKVTYNKDLNGNAFALDKYYMMVKYPANVTVKRNFSVNGTDANATDTFLAYTTMPVNTKYSAFRGEKLCAETTDKQQWDTEYAGFASTLYDCDWRPAYRGENFDNIIKFEVNDSVGFPVGAIIKIWGRDAI